MQGALGFVFRVYGSANSTDAITLDATCATWADTSGGTSAPGGLSWVVQGTGTTSGVLDGAHHVMHGMITLAQQTGGPFVPCPSPYVRLRGTMAANTATVTVDVSPIYETNELLAASTSINPFA
jgi:hypothetical protein